MGAVRGWDLERELRGLRHWLKNTRDRDGTRLELEAALAAHRRAAADRVGDSVFTISQTLQYVGLWAGHRGAVAVLRGDAAGWADLHCGLECYGWLLRTEHELLVRRQLKYGAEPRLASLYLLQALATGADDWADWLGDHVFDDFQRKKRPFSRVPSLSAGGLAARLYAVWRGRDLHWASQRGYRAGVYKELWRSWDDPARLGAALRSACDFHCEQAVRAATEDAWTGEEFVHPPFNIFPADILAVRRVRSDLGLETPTITHPLLDSPLAAPPDRPPPHGDALVSEAVAVLARDLQPAAAPASPSPLNGSGAHEALSTSPPRRRPAWQA
jgi:hypothetical protein